MESTLRGVLGLGVTLFVLAAGMATINGLARTWAAKSLAKDPNNANAQAVALLF